MSIAGQFAGGTGRYMYHCHILEHEDEGMMRTFVVMPEEVMALDPHMDHGLHHSHWQVLRESPPPPASDGAPAGRCAPTGLGGWTTA
ncbi:MAG: hypothetical protein QOH57_2830 [Mycobacterium sp.]|nr:hypothetical protein [Mycobacterium sp.]